jgi:hypothetical protein
MIKRPLSLFLICVGLAATVQSCRNDEYLAAPPPVANQSFVEQFDTMQNAYNSGWRWLNRSTPIGVTSWMQAPGTAAMSAYSSRGTNAGAAYANYESTAGTNNGIISNWLVSPSVTMQNGDKIIFYTKTELFGTGATATDFGARMQVRMNETNDALNVGNGDDPGNFTTVLLEINSNEDEYIPSAPIATAYPGNWTRFEATVFGLNGPTKGRFAFRYFLHGAGSAGAGNGIGVDSVAYVGRK